jgi:hypothetical protein
MIAYPFACSMTSLKKKRSQKDFHEHLASDRGECVEKDC